MSHFPWQRNWNPFQELQREVGRFFERMDPRSRMIRPFPLVNLYESPERYVLLVELPGMTVDDLELSIVGETLTIKGQRTRPEGVSDESYRRQERMFGAWSRSITLPQRVDPERVEADLQNGILAVSMPKSESVLPRQIPVVCRQR